MILFVVLLASAASAQPVRPPVPVFVPSQDAPHTTGQPGHVRPDVDYPRSPHKRALPPTAGPGIWAGDEPKSDVEPIVVVTGVPIYPSGQPRIDGVVSACGADLDRAAVESGLPPRLMALSENAHLCIVARMMLQCAIMRHEIIKSRDPVDELALAKHNAAVRYLQYVTGLECKGIGADQDRDLLLRWSAALTPFTRRGTQ